MKTKAEETKEVCFTSKGRYGILLHFYKEAISWANNKFFMSTP